MSDTQAPSSPAISRQVHRARCLPLPEPSLEETFRLWNAELTARVADGRLLTTALYRDAYSLFLYNESLGDPFNPETDLPAGDGILLPWPELDADPVWVPMVDVFHFNSPASLEHWRRPTPPLERQGRLLRLRPECVASYIYHHYQLQEERAFLGEKYKFIALHGSLLFMYNELPAPVERPPLPGLLSTHGTPANWADAGMDRHFIPWDEATPFSRGIQLVFAV